MAMTNTCEHLNCLPEPGGLLDQDSFLIFGMDLVFEVQEEKRELDERTRESTEKRNRLRQ